MRPPRLLYLPNEQHEGDQVGPRIAFEAMRDAGELEAYRSFSFLVELSSSGPARMQQALLREAAAFQPDLLLWQHVGATPLAADFVGALHQAAPAMALIYHEGDMYGRGKPLPATTRLLLQQADVVSLVGQGEFAAQVRALGARHVLYSPQSVDGRRFGTAWVPSSEREFDVVLIGNRVRSRLPWRLMPGAARRVELAAALGQRYGRRFGLFGHGWDGFAGWQGPLRYDDQELALRRAWLSVGWDHFDAEAGYFSDRLPISLISGVPHLTNHQPGYEAVFGAAPPLHWARSVPEMLDVAQRLLALGGPALDELGRRAQDYCREHFAAEVVYRRLLAQAQDALQDAAVPLATRRGRA
jgi:hypothetical protein